MRRSPCTVRETVAARGAALCAIVSNNATHVRSALDAIFEAAARDDLSADASELLPETLRRLLELCPQGGALVAAAARRRYPYLTAPTARHRAYASFCLKRADADGVLRLVTEKALELDCHAELDAPKNEMFQLDDGASDGGAAAALDDVLELCFERTERRLREDGDGALDEWLRVFDACILQTQGCRCVQFLPFYAAATDPGRAAAFARHLALRVADDAAPDVARVASVSYLSSFVCRCRAVDAALVALGAEALFAHAEACVGPAGGQGGKTPRLRAFLRAAWSGRVPEHWCRNFGEFG